MKCFMHPQAKLRKAKWLNETFFVCSDERHIDDPEYPILSVGFGRLWVFTNKQYLILGSSDQNNYLRMSRGFKGKRE